ncbi:hypothetical protein [Falsibacillus albus]|uniref:Uncharacterized protein n=1 Tax=Falsibacillus albus TaxID=2478915 RepID=A0A3L7JWK5_9BACI|nr:hypothetical protein [Falsibacillus albus]RLQ94051.1 hypothetical protein D9X91_15570 [Falsibacillus albus]
MLALSSRDQLQEAHDSLQALKGSEPELFGHFLHVVNLTRQLQFKYQYMGSLIANENPLRFHPKNVEDSVMALYHAEIEKLKAADANHTLRGLLKDHAEGGYAKISLLILGNPPESLVGFSIIK